MTAADLISPVLVSVAVEIAKRFGLPDYAIKPAVLGAAFVASLVPLFAGLGTDALSVAIHALLYSIGASGVYEWLLKTLLPKGEDA